MYPCGVGLYATCHLLICPISSKYVQFPTVSEFNEFRLCTYISQDELNDMSRVVIRDLEKFRILIEITILPFFRNSNFPGLHINPTYSGVLLKQNSHIFRLKCVPPCSPSTSCLKSTLSSRDEFTHLFYS